MTPFLLAAFLCLSILILAVRRALKPGLSSIPGPFFAKSSNLWRLWRILNGRYKEDQLELHRKYGDVVRVSHDTVLVFDPRAIEPLLGAHARLDKSDHVYAFRNVVNGQVLPTVLSTKESSMHASIRKPMTSTYSMSNLRGYEPFVDITIVTFISRLDELYIGTGNRCEIDVWLQYFAFDVISTLTMGRPLGFLAAGHDVDGMIADLDRDFAWKGVCTQMPIVDWLLRRNPISLYLFPNGRNKAVSAAREHLADRMKENNKEEKHNVNEGVKADFVSHLLSLRSDSPDSPITDRTIFTVVAQNLLAGSDTTSVVLRASLYYVVRHPAVLARLRAELDSANVKYPVPWKVANAELPYTDALVNEILRIHPVSAMLFEREAPAGGFTLPDGRVLPKGTVVAMNFWNPHYNTTVYGADVDAFRPERWLQGYVEGETTEEFDVRLRGMKNTLVAFSKGPRGCLGKNVALLEIYKLVPTLFGVLDFELADPDRVWTYEQGFFTKQKDMDMNVRWREGWSLERFMAAAKNN